MRLLPFDLYARSCGRDKMNQYWSLSEPVLLHVVTSSGLIADQYWLLFEGIVE